MNERATLIVLSGALGVVFTASLLAFHTNVSHQITGSLFVLAGAVIIASAKDLPAQSELAKWPVLQRLVRLRPLTLVLWGSGMVICGILLASGIGP